MPAHHAVAVANEVLDAAKSRGFSVTPMQLQKLLYFCHGWNLDVRGEPLVSEGFQAWQFGPVQPSVYHEFKHYGSSNITDLTDLGFGGQPMRARLTQDESDLIGEVVSIYGGLSGPQMSHLTHKAGTPWFEVWDGGVGKGDVIPDKHIKREFQGLRQSAA